MYSDDSVDEPQTSGPDPDEDGTQFLDFALDLAENIKLLVLVPLAAGIVALGVAFLIPSTFTATTQILPPQAGQSTAGILMNQIGALGLGSVVGDVKNPADTYAELIKSRTVADRIVERFKLMALYEVKFEEDARKELADNTSVKADKKSGVIVIEVDDHDPKRAADLANAYVEELRGLNQNLAVTEAAQRRLFFEKQLKQTSDDLMRSQAALRGSGVSEATLKTVPESALAVVADLKARITVQEVALASMRGFMSDGNPKLQRVQQELSALRAQLSKAGKDDAPEVRGSAGEYGDKYREFKYRETLFDLLVKQYEAARLDEAREGAVIQVIDPARPPERKSKPKKALIAVLSTLLAFFLTLCAVFVRQGLRDAAVDPVKASKLERLRAYLRLPRG